MKHANKRLAGGFVMVALLLLSSQSYGQDAPAQAAANGASVDSGKKLE
jgi:hypothetical protein